MTLLTVSEMSVWTRQEIDPADAWALTVVAAASDVVRAAARQPTWTRATAPVRARQIASHLAARTFTNPGSVSSEGLGPISERRVEELSRALHLTEAEQSELERLAPTGARGALWIQPVGSNALVSQPVFLAASAASDWLIEYAHPDDAYAFTPLVP